jgi:hypothetical protein
MHDTFLFFFSDATYKPRMRMAIRKKNMFFLKIISARPTPKFFERKKEIA